MLRLVVGSHVLLRDAYLRSYTSVAYSLVLLLVLNARQDINQATPPQSERPSSPVTPVFSAYPIEIELDLYTHTLDSSERQTSSSRVRSTY